MKRVIIAILLISLVTGCIETGTEESYYQKDLNETLTLYSDNTFLLSRPSIHETSGTYRIDDKYLRLIFPWGGTYSLRIETNRLVDDKDGGIWEKV